MSTPCKFKVGDRVKHRASGEIAIVAEVETRCSKHSAFEHMQMGMLHASVSKKDHDLGECERVDTGMVTVSKGFDASTQLDAMELEAAE